MFPQLLSRFGVADSGMSKVDKNNATLRDYEGTVLLDIVGNNNGLNELLVYVTRIRITLGTLEYFLMWGLEQWFWFGCLHGVINFADESATAFVHTVDHLRI